MQKLASAPGERAAEVRLRVDPLDMKKLALDGTFEGYASIFNRRDLGSDVVLPGAFRGSLATRGAANIRMLFQHDPAQPIGVWERIYEDARGLYVRGRLTTEVAKAREVLALMRAGAIDGLSIGFRAVDGKRDGRTGIRKLAEIDLWEISVVTFPMLPEARVSNVKSQHVAFERWLTQQVGFTRPEAREAIRDGRSGIAALRKSMPASDWQARLITQMTTAAGLLRRSPGFPPRNPRARGATW